MADDVLDVPPQQSSGVVGSRTFFRESKQQRNISDIQVQGSYPATTRDGYAQQEKGMVMQSINN